MKAVCIVGLNGFNSSMLTQISDFSQSESRQRPVALALAKEAIECRKSSALGVGPLAGAKILGQLMDKVSTNTWTSFHFL